MAVYVLIYDVNAFQATYNFPFPYDSTSTSSSGSFYSYVDTISPSAFFIGHYAYYGSNSAHDPIDFRLYSSGNNVYINIYDLTTSSQVVYAAYIFLQTQINCPAPTAWVSANNQC